MAADDAPIIATLLLDAASQAMFDAVRTRYFPPDRLVVGAHVTLFHALPAESAPHIAAAVQDLCARTSPFSMRVSGVRFLGRGVALDLQAEAAQGLRASLRASFAAGLTAQDRAPWRAHVTVQNKVSAEQARQTWQALQGFSCLVPVSAKGIALWRYRGGPWEAMRTFWLGCASP